MTYIDNKDTVRALCGMSTFLWRSSRFGFIVWIAISSFGLVKKTAQ